MGKLRYEIATTEYVDDLVATTETYVNNSIATVTAKIPTITASTTDIGEGASLSHGEIYLVLE